MTELGAPESWFSAFRRLADAEHFPELTARLRLVSPEAARDAEASLAIMERAFAEGWVVPRPPRARTGRTVAVVGGGMLGLAAAAALNEAGHHVRVYESSPHLGGLLCVGMGHVRVEQWVIDRRVRLLEAEGVELVTGARIGEDIRFDELREVSDALLLAIGSRRPRRLRVPGLEHRDVCDADTFLRAGARFPGRSVDGATALILGDGEGATAARRRLLDAGAARVDIAPLLGGDVQAALDRRPEGAWPLVHVGEGGERCAVAVVAVEGDGERVRSVRFVRVDVAQDPAGHPVIVPRPGSAFSVPADLVVVAAGYVGPDTRPINAQLGVELDMNGNVRGDRRFGTSVPGVYYAGDANPGASSLLWDLSQGLEAAAVIDARLSGR
jgi:glutamate synthase (NADPH/NADH) small chain